MSDDKEKVEDFISLWRKKMMDDPKKPSAIGETLKQMEEVQRENEELRSKIKENIDLISKTEEIVRKTIDENERLKIEIKQASVRDGPRINDIQNENQELRIQLNTLNQNLIDKDQEIRGKNNQIIEVNTRLSEAFKKMESITQPPSETDPSTKVLIDDLQSELSKKKSNIIDLEKNIADLNKEVELLNEQLIEKETKSHVDYVIPVEIPDTSVIKPQPVQTSTETLEILCQDLQADLNKYKRIVDTLTKEKTELKKTIETGGFTLEPEELKELKNENDELKTELSQLQEQLKEKPKATVQTLSLVESERLIEDLKQQLESKAQIITELKTQKESQILTQRESQTTSPRGPMSNLVEDLQNRINKLKIALEEKNKI
ncbi:MAG: hypothetical protein ACW99L_15745, partial [Promethearchaeota archaeon]